MEEVKTLKQAMRREKNQEEHKSNGTWIAFTVARTRYKNAVRDVQLSVVSEKVSECDTDTCKLYSPCQQPNRLNQCQPYVRSSRLR